MTRYQTEKNHYHMIELMIYYLTTWLSETANYEMMNPITFVDFDWKSSSSVSFLQGDGEDFYFHYQHTLDL